MQPSKLNTRVRFPSPAPSLYPRTIPHHPKSNETPENTDHKAIPANPRYSPLCPLILDSVYGGMYGATYLEPNHTRNSHETIRNKAPAFGRSVLASLEPEAKEYRENYGIDRLYFVVSSTGRKRWELRFKKRDGKWGWHDLYSYPDVTAKKARDKAQEAQRLNVEGVDPITHKASLKASRDAAEANTFKAAADLWLVFRL